MAEPHYAPNKSPKAAVLAEDHRRSSWRMDSRTTETEERGVENPRIPLFSHSQETRRTTVSKFTQRYSGRQALEVGYQAWSESPRDEVG